MHEGTAPDHQSAGPVEHIRRRIRGEYTEMPGLCLTARQARRLWNLDPDLCESLLESLVTAGFLNRVHRDPGAWGEDLRGMSGEWYFVRLHH